MASFECLMWEASKGRGGEVGSSSTDAIPGRELTLWPFTYLLNSPPPSPAEATCSSKPSQDNSSLNFPFLLHPQPCPRDFPNGPSITNPYYFQHILASTSPLPCPTCYQKWKGMATAQVAFPPGNFVY